MLRLATGNGGYSAGAVLPPEAAPICAVLPRRFFVAYGWTEDIADEDVLKNLLALNLEQSERGASTPNLA